MSPEVEATAEETSRQVTGLVALWAAGSISLPTFREMFVAIVYAAKVSAAVLAEAILWRDYDLPPLGIGPGEPSRDALTAAVETMTEGMPDAMPEGVPEAMLEAVSGPVVTFSRDLETRSTRVAADAPKESARQTKRARFERAGFTAWRWVAGPDACDECRARHGTTYAIDIAMRDHPQCECDLEPDQLQGEAHDRAAA